MTITTVFLIIDSKDFHHNKDQDENFFSIDFNLFDSKDFHHNKDQDRINP